MSDQNIPSSKAVRWLTGTVWPLAMSVSQACAAVQEARCVLPAAGGAGGAFSGPEGEGCALSDEELRILWRESPLAGGVL